MPYIDGNKNNCVDTKTKDKFFTLLRQEKSGGSVYRASSEHGWLTEPQPTCTHCGSQEALIHSFVEVNLATNTSSVFLVCRNCSDAIVKCFVCAAKMYMPNNNWLEGEDHQKRCVTCHKTYLVTKDEDEEIIEEVRESSEWRLGGRSSGSISGRISNYEPLAFSITTTVNTNDWTFVQPNRVVQTPPPVTGLPARPMTATEVRERTLTVPVRQVVPDPESPEGMMYSTEELRVMAEAARREHLRTLPVPQQEDDNGAPNPPIVQEPVDPRRRDSIWGTASPYYTFDEEDNDPTQ